MAGDARGIHGGAAWRIDPAGHSPQGRSLEFWAVHIPEHSKSNDAAAGESAVVLGNGAAGGVRRSGAGTRGAGAGDQAEVAVCAGRALGLVADPGGDCDTDVGGGAAENLEQHAHRDEPGEAPATAAESAHGRPFAPDESALFFQPPEYGVDPASRGSAFSA